MGLQRGPLGTVTIPPQDQGNQDGRAGHRELHATPCPSAWEALCPEQGWPPCKRLTLGRQPTPVPKWHKSGLGD